MLFPSGDEPHYLVIAQSLWRDGDFKIENNHQRGDYREYFAATWSRITSPAARTARSTPSTPFGLPMLLAPIYGAGRLSRARCWR